MKFKTLLTLAAALAVGVTNLAADDTPLGKEMSAMNKSLRTLKRQLSDPSKKADNVALVDKMKANVAESMKHEPAITKDQPAGDKAAFLAKYQEQMKDLDKTLDELKAAVEKGDNEAATGVFDKLADVKEKGHKDFAPEE